MRVADRARIGSGVREASCRTVGHPRRRREVSLAGTRRTNGPIGRRVRRALEAPWRQFSPAPRLHPLHPFLNPVSRDRLIRERRQFPVQCLPEPGGQRLQPAGLLVHAFTQFVDRTRVKSLS